MELQRGICSLCSESGKVFSSSNALEFLNYLPRILVENFLTESQFQEIKDSLKICSICCYKLELSSDLKNNMKNPGNGDISDSLDIHCHFCNSTKCVIKVKDDWNFFIQRTNGFLKLTDYPVDICYRCIFYFDTIFNFKTKLSYKFPQLAVHIKPQKKQNETPKRKSLSSSAQSSKKRKIFDNCFTYLQPLCNDNYHVDAKVRADAKMYKKIAYVNLQNMDYNKKVKSKVRPQIKIKLKKSSKKAQREKYQNKSTLASLKEHSIISQPFVKLCKSKEIPSIINKEEEKQRSLSIERENEALEEKIDETPKAATTTNLAPKRRVSLYVNLTNAEAESEETESKSDGDKKTNSVESNNIVAKYIEDTTFNDSTKLELLQEIEDNSVKVTIENAAEGEIENTVEHNVEKNIEENGIIEKVEEKQEEKIPESKNDSEPQSEELQEEEEICELMDIPDSPPSTPSQEFLKKISGSSEDSDFDEDDKVKENDSLNGSERKKKRVTFSDDTSFSNE